MLQPQQNCYSKGAADNLSAVLYSAKDMRMEQRPVPEPQENQVMKKIGRMLFESCPQDLGFYSDDDVRTKCLGRFFGTCNSEAEVVVVKVIN